MVWYEDVLGLWDEAFAAELKGTVNKDVNEENAMKLSGFWLLIGVTLFGYISLSTTIQSHAPYKVMGKSVFIDCQP